MALKKAIELDNGVIVNYHRIYAIEKRTNVAVWINIHSYINKAKRDEEKEAEDRGEQIFPFKNCFMIEAPYDETKEIEDYYTYLKTLEMFVGAEDI